MSMGKLQGPRLDLGERPQFAGFLSLDCHSKDEDSVIFESTESIPVAVKV